MLKPEVNGLCIGCLYTRERCPEIAVALHNIYGSEASLHLGDGLRILSREGTTQGCPLGMAMFALSTLPLIAAVAVDAVRQLWYADDSAAVGTVRGVKAWFDRLGAEGDEFGYEIKLSKTVAIVKPEHEAAFHRAFKGHTGQDGIRVVCSGIPELDRVEGAGGMRFLGQRYLGAGIGSVEFREACVRKKVEGWVADVRKLAALGRTHPHQAYCLFVRSLLPRWRYTMRTVRTAPDLYQPLEEALVGSFFPAVFGWAPSERALRGRCALPTRHGGLGIPAIPQLAKEEAVASKSLTETLTAAVLRQDDEFIEDIRASRTRRAMRLKERDTAYRERADELAEGLSGRAARGFQEARMRGGSAWLAFLPLEALGLDLDSVTFRDAVALRMGLPLPESVPSMCPSCGIKADTGHLLKCKRGGWVSRRHKEVLRAWKAYLERGGATAVYEEPFLLPVRHGVLVRPGTTLAPEARADIVARGVFQHGKDEYFDIAVLDTGAPCYEGKSSAEVLEKYEEKKNTKYKDRVAPHGSFTPLICSIYGTLAPAAAKTAHRVARQVDPEREERDAVLDLHHVLIQTSVLKATSLCLRARSWAVLPQVAASEALEDASSWLATADARADI